MLGLRLKTISLPQVLGWSKVRVRTYLASHYPITQQRDAGKILTPTCSVLYCAIYSGNVLFQQQMIYLGAVMGYLWVLALSPGGVCPVPVALTQETLQHG